MKYTKYCSCGNALLGHDACNGTNICSDCYRAYVMEQQQELIKKSDFPALWEAWEAVTPPAYFTGKEFKLPDLKGQYIK